MSGQTYITLSPVQFSLQIRDSTGNACLGLAIGGRGQQQAMIARLDRLDILLSQGTQLTPPQRVDLMVLVEGIELVEGAQSFSAMSSTDDLPC